MSFSFNCNTSPLYSLLPSTKLNVGKFTFLPSNKSDKFLLNNVVSSAFIDSKSGLPFLSNSLTLKSVK